VCIEVVPDYIAVAEFHIEVADFHIGVADFHIGVEVVDSCRGVGLVVRFVEDILAVDLVE